jgi:hypothetical protein
MCHLRAWKSAAGKAARMEYVPRALPCAGTKWTDVWAAPVAVLYTQ